MKSFAAAALLCCLLSSCGEPVAPPTVTRTPFILQTGQTISYAPGDDGDLRYGRAWPSPRFTNNGDGTVSDNLTGLMWQRTPDGVGKDWPGAVTYANTNTLAGYDDWRLPNINELSSLINRDKDYFNNWMNTEGFSGVVFDFYWTSTTLAYDTASAGWVRLNGVSGGAPKTTATYLTLIVRGDSTLIQKTGQVNPSTSGDDGAYQKGVAWPLTRFVDNGNGTVSDKLTGLMWQQSPSTVRENWTNALDIIATNTLAGFSDWRMPNINELQSLFNYGVSNTFTWLNDNCHFSGIQGDYYWSSTTHAVNTPSALAMNLSLGGISGSTKTITNLLWAVRTE